ncbi:hypothetical protein DSO57_1024861 [Entomophthora muscae]|uniref:Uncharacterized protein n=1 Tax=Entomophthora muscae TaxID=34485 RepID=A0ACC2S4I6_9FUNG|nr:hypothetical protein DSO57_1024861 [Entomophthora muscae]
MSKVTCHCCNCKGHYANSCTSKTGHYYPGKRPSRVETGLSHSTINNPTNVPTVPPGRLLQAPERPVAPPYSADHSPDKAELFVLNVGYSVNALHRVRIDNFSPLELQAQERESNLEPGFPRAAGPEDRKTNCLHFSGIKPLQADVEEDNPPRKVDQDEEIIALSGMPITTPNGGNQATTISFMSL